MPACTAVPQPPSSGKGIADFSSAHAQRWEPCLFSLSLIPQEIAQQTSVVLIPKSLEYITFLCISTTTCISQGSPEKQNQQGVCVQREMGRDHWLVQLRERTSPSLLGSATGWRPKEELRFLLESEHVWKQKFLLPRRTSIFSPKSFNLLNEAHPHYGFYSKVC